MCKLSRIRLVSVPSKSKIIAGFPNYCFLYCFQVKRYNIHLLSQFKYWLISKNFPVRVLVNLSVSVTQLQTSRRFLAFLKNIFIF